jgi:hypothetical protein
VDIADILPYRLIFAIDRRLWQIYNRNNEGGINFATEHLVVEAGGSSANVSLPEIAVI